MSSLYNQCYIFEDSFSKLNSSTKVSFENTLVLGDLSIYLLNAMWLFENTPYTFLVTLWHYAKLSMKYSGFIRTFQSSMWLFENICNLHHAHCISVMSCLWKKFLNLCISLTELFSPWNSVFLNSKELLLLTLTLPWIGFVYVVFEEYWWKLISHTIDYYSFYLIVMLFTLEFIENKSAQQL